MTVGRTPPPTRATVDGRAYLDLRAMAKKSGRANDEYLRLYALEGFLLRLAASASSQDFVLKGGVLLAAYQLRRPTADIDFAALKTSNDVETIKSMIITVADTQLPDFTSDSLRVESVEGQGHAGARLSDRVPRGRLSLALSRAEPISRGLRRPGRPRRRARASGQR